MFPRKRVMQGHILQLAWPVVLEMFWIMMVNVLLTMMMGGFGAAALAAVGLATLVQFSTAMIFAALGTGSSAIIARAWGAGNMEDVRAVAGQALLSGALLGIMVTAGGVVAAPQVFLMTGAELAVSELAGRLLQIQFLSTPLFMLLAIGNAILRGMGQTRTAFLISAASNTVILLTSYWLIFGMSGTALGAYGAAWGTCLGQAAGGILAVLVLQRHKKLALRWGDVSQVDTAVVARILQISIPAALEQCSMQGGRIAFTLLLAEVGAVQFAAHQIAMQIESISFLPGFGFSVAAMTLIGQQLGKGLPERGIRYVWLTAGMTFGGMAVMGLIFFLLAEPLTRLFISDPAVIAWGTLCVRIAALEQVTIALTYVLSGALRGAGDTKWSMLVTTVGVWLVRMPLIYVFIRVWHYDITAAWFITAGDFLVRSVLLWWRFASNKWQLAAEKLAH